VVRDIEENLWGFFMKRKNETNIRIYILILRILVWISFDLKKKKIIYKKNIKIKRSKQYIKYMKLNFCFLFHKNVDIDKKKI
jgi:predicted transcriptional regulator